MNQEETFSRLAGEIKIELTGRVRKRWLWFIPRFREYVFIVKAKASNGRTFKHVTAEGGDYILQYPEMYLKTVMNNFLNDQVLRELNKPKLPKLDKIKLAEIITVKMEA